jgi:hypothetical protein
MLATYLIGVGLFCIFLLSGCSPVGPENSNKNGFWSFVEDKYYKSANLIVELNRINSSLIRFKYARWDTTEEYAIEYSGYLEGANDNIEIPFESLNIEGTEYVPYINDLEPIVLTNPPEYMLDNQYSIKLSAGNIPSTILDSLKFNDPIECASFKIGQVINKNMGLSIQWTPSNAEDFVLVHVTPTKSSNPWPIHFFDVDEKKGEYFIPPDELHKLPNGVCDLRIERVEPKFMKIDDVDACIIGVSTRIISVILE